MNLVAAPATPAEVGDEGGVVAAVCAAVFAAAVAVAAILQSSGRSLV